MNAREIQQAVEGVAAECLDKYLKFNNVYAPKWVNEDRLFVNDSHAAKIQEASMRNWLEEHPQINDVKGWVSDGMYYIQLEKHIGGGSYFVGHPIYAPTRLEALAKACKALDQAKEKAQ